MNIESRRMEMADTAERFAKEMKEQAKKERRGADEIQTAGTINAETPEEGM